MKVPAIGRFSINDLQREAVKACESSYSPYSRFPVGAVVVAGQRLFTGANIENASFGLTICAERVAIFRAITAGCKQIDALLIYTPTEAATMPCGSCRQVMAEFSGGQMPIFSACEDEVIHSVLAEIMPLAFGQENLLKRSGT